VVLKSLGQRRASAASLDFSNELGRAGF
jgi:hypothetical protein